MSDLNIKGTSRGPAALWSHMSDSSHKRVLYIGTNGLVIDLSLYLRGQRGFITKGRNTPLRPLVVPLR